MNAAEIFHRYQTLQHYVGWTPEDAARLRSLRAPLDPWLLELVGDFYEQILRNPHTHKVITGGSAQVERLRGTLLAWLRDLLTGPHDQAYVARRWRVGLRHVEIGLDQVYTNVALARLRQGLLRLLEQHPEASSAHAVHLYRRSINLALDLDLAIIEDAYQTEYLRRQQETERLLRETELKEAQEKALQAERLATIGQMMTGLAHESGNALARSQSCLEMLSWELEDRSEALELVGRIQDAQEQLRQLYEEVRGYAAPIQLDREPWDLSLIWRQAWENLALARKNRHAELVEKLGDANLLCVVDQFRLGQVFRNILENSLAACSDPVRISITCSLTSLLGEEAVQISVGDNGPGMSPLVQRRLFEAFFTTKKHGTGLGLAIAKRIVEAHQGQIQLGSGSSGANIVLTLPRGKLPG